MHVQHSKTQDGIARLLTICRHTFHTGDQWLWMKRVKEVSQTTTSLHCSQREPSGLPTYSGLPPAHDKIYRKSCERTFADSMAQRPTWVMLRHTVEKRGGSGVELEGKCLTIRMVALLNSQQPYLHLLVKPKGTRIYFR